MKARTLTALSVLNDLRHAAYEALERKHRYPALLLLYSFIDICASLACEQPTVNNGTRFKSYVNRYGHTSGAVTVEDLWAARSTLLHSFSPLGRNTESGAARPIFYFAWPETSEAVRAVLDSKGYSDYLLLDVGHIKTISIWCFNAFWRRVQTEPDFEEVMLQNSEHLLKDLFQHGLEMELTAIETLVAKAGEGNRAS
ncbi:hypothetical protein [Caenimonas soli]|uniref:hypothetical protein n=1 Tax=Caenimonas soli TaxID=2735555 RepID=UPI00155772F9|nr:hypothetical protein [Caenimonas soli]NPC57855.1 hypothetical protein [Caenimonas soli]